MIYTLEEIQLAKQLWQQNVKSSRPTKIAFGVVSLNRGNRVVQGGSRSKTWEEYLPMARQRLRR